MRNVVDSNTGEPYIPTKQRPAKDLIKLGVTIPYFHPVDRDHLAVNCNVTVAILPPDKLDQLVLMCRKHAAVACANPLDNRKDLDYPVTDRERHAFVRHCCLNRTERNLHTVSGYIGGYDNIIHRINKKGVDCENRVRLFKEHVCALISAAYPNLALESKYYLWRLYRQGEQQ